jgi:hypothetical protein
MSYYILPKTNNNIHINVQNHNVEINYVKTNDENKLYVSNTLYNYYYDIMKEINFFFIDNEISYCILNELSFNTLEEFVRIVNPYEYIHTVVTGSKISVSKLKTDTNIFYDFLEIIITLNLLESKQKDIQLLLISKNYKDIIQCIELVRENNNDQKIFFHEINDTYFHSINNNNIEYYDFMFFEANTETNDTYIIDLIKFIMIIFKQMKNNGICIIKIDAIFYKPIVDILYLLSSCFEKVYIIKPNTNNITTFEKYIVCKYFILNENKNKLYNLNYHTLGEYLLNFNFNLKHEKIRSLIDSDTPCYFINKINDINTIIGQQQLESLHQIINILNSRNKNDKIELMKKTNIQKCVNWCEKFKLPCNKFTEKTNMFLPVSKENENSKYNISNIFANELNNDMNENNDTSDMNDTNENNSNVDINFYFDEN